VAVIVNYVGFFLFALSHDFPENSRDPAAYIAVDFFFRLGLFFGLHAVIYAVSAAWFGSFGGSRATALRVVAPTLARSAFFENISGVYVCATLISAIPWYISAVRRASRLAPIVRLFLAPIGPIAVAFLIFAAAVVCFTALASAFMRLQS
jgi:hypothetical protein